MGAIEVRGLVKRYGDTTTVEILEARPKPSRQDHGSGWPRSPDFGPRHEPRNGDRVLRERIGIVFLPLAVVSDMFFVSVDPPTWTKSIGAFFPLEHFAITFGAPPNPLLEGLQFQWGHLAYIALWGVAAARSFRWEQRPEKSRDKTLTDA